MCHDRIAALGALRRTAERLGTCVHYLNLYADGTVGGPFPHRILAMADVVRREARGVAYVLTSVSAWIAGRAAGRSEIDLRREIGQLRPDGPRAAALAFLVHNACCEEYP